MSSASSQVSCLAMFECSGRCEFASLSDNALLVMFFRYVVSVPCWNLDHDLAGLGDLRLTSQTGVQLQIGGHVEPVSLVVVHFGKIVGPFLHPDVAGGASVVA